MTDLVYNVIANRMKGIIFILLCGFIALGRTELCSEDVTMYDMPEGVLKTMITMSVTGTVLGFTGCKSDITINPDKVGFWLYNKQNRDTPILLNHDNPKEINPSQKIIFITHGWTCNITGNGFPQLKEAYLKRYPDANIILVEWTTYSVDLYVNSFCFIPKIAEEFGRFICNLNSKFNVDLSKIRLVGHSMGGQISGLTGQETQKQCGKKIGRITALDPAGPIYQNVGENRRLDPSDAIVVDVIHSNQAQFGYIGKCGTIDYYPNCGFFQPGCVQFTPTTNISAYLNLPFSIFACSHQRSIELLLESIGNPEAFSAKSCTLCPGLPPFGVCVADVLRSTKSIMGEGDDKTTGSFYLKTNSVTPFTLK